MRYLIGLYLPNEKVLFVNQQKISNLGCVFCHKGTSIDYNKSKECASNSLISHCLKSKGDNTTLFAN